jgi:hypothetical protein
VWCTSGQTHVFTLVLLFARSQCLDAVAIAIVLSHATPELVRFPLRFCSRTSTSPPPSSSMASSSSFASSSNVANAATAAATAAVGFSYHWHIVLGLSLHGVFGALGLSRAPGLGSHDLSYASLDELVEAYAAHYAAIGHDVVKVVGAEPILFITFHLASQLLACASVFTLAFWSMCMRLCLHR